MHRCVAFAHHCIAFGNRSGAFAKSLGVFGYRVGVSANPVRVFARRFREARQAIVAFGIRIRGSGSEGGALRDSTYPPSYRPRELQSLYARDRYLFSRVSMMILTPGSMNGGTLTTRPVSIFAGL